MYHDELVQVAQTVWESMLQLELAPAEREYLPTTEDLTARIDISGAWRGYVVASCGEGLARKLAGLLLRSQPEQLPLPHVGDALAEIVNMLGGGIKALFPGPCELSLPQVSLRGEAAPEVGCELLDRICFDCRGDSFSVELRHFA